VVPEPEKKIAHCYVLVPIFFFNDFSELRKPAGEANAKITNGIRGIDIKNHTPQKSIIKNEELIVPKYEIFKKGIIYRLLPMNPTKSMIAPTITNVALVNILFLPVGFRGFFKP